MPINIGDTRAKKVYLGDTLIYQEQPKSNAVFFKANGQGSWVQVAVTWNTDHYECAPATNPGFVVALTTDGNEPAADLSNVNGYFQWTSGSSFGIIAIVDFTSTTNGDAPIQISI